MPLTDVQWVLGHAHLSTTGLYMSPLPEDVLGLCEFVAGYDAHTRRIEHAC